MKALLPCFLILLTLISCQEEEDKLTFERLRLDENPCTDCPEISIEIPRAIERTKTAAAINTALREEIIAMLLFDDEVEVSDLDDALISFSNGYAELQKRYADETTPWEAKIDGEIVYEDPKILTVQLDSYVFTGGAHGYSAKRFLNFDKQRGVELENWQLFQNRKDFQKYAETKFREQEGISSEAPINQTGLMFEQNRFYLPENIGFSEEGVKLLYNPYEVASYADGPIVLTLPFKEVKPYLTSNTKS
ncbi:DUF3298 and DUF4163 domain-containing protein [Pricia sp. S334]|uniref:DUF3298 and DUF4163 domain-containing protein n=1 Tax=Pricia mediterranea TaxID=3076079 RepID=A0ABU3L6T8_9FLAO|nr:DUF3298 and DUF4163 domain-containing protein [Pricia sp. S334]MDT7829063.1 DUF3298 and DUF4163 domain-containing protein [Pricia sp. S334]